MKQIMMGYLKWAIPGGLGLIVLGAFIGSKMSNQTSDSAPIVRPVVAVTSASYPAPTISIISRPITQEAAENVQHSSSLYGSNGDYERLGHKSHSRKRRSKSTPKKAIVAGADPDLGFMAADDPKLKQAESEAAKSRNDRSSIGADDPLLKPAAKGY